MAIALVALARWPAWRWAVAAVGVALAGLVIGVPTGVVPTPLYSRMTPVTWWDYPVWAASSVLAGITLATYVRGGGTRVPAAGDPARRSIVATVASTFAVGCPVCNKLVVALLGAGGALDYWAPLQPVLGAAAVGLLAAGLALRLRGAVACSTRTAYDTP